MLLLGVEAALSREALSLESSLPETFPTVRPLPPPLRAKEADIPCLVQDFLLALSAYMESAATHLILTFISLSHNPSGICPIERHGRDAPDKRDLVCLYVVDFCTGLKRLRFLASHDGTYMVTVNTDNTAVGLSACKQPLFLYKDLSSYGNPLLAIPYMSE